MITIFRRESMTTLLDITHKIKEYKGKIHSLQLLEIDAMNKLMNFIVENKLYQTDLTKYANDSIDKMTIIIKDKDRIVHYTFDDVNIDENGHFSALNYGEYSHWGYVWSDEYNQYVYTDCFSEKKIPVDFIGFYFLDELMKG